MTWRVPDLSECAPGIEPTEFKVLVAMAEKPKVTGGGIILPEATKEREEFARDKGRLIAVSPIAFSYAKWPEGVRHPQVGDVVHCGRYAGATVEGADGRKYQLMADQDIGAVLERGA